MYQRDIKSGDCSAKFLAVQTRLPIRALPRSGDVSFTRPDTQTPSPALRIHAPCDQGVIHEPYPQILCADLAEDAPAGSDSANSEVTRNRDGQFGAISEQTCSAGASFGRRQWDKGQKTWVGSMVRRDTSSEGRCGCCNEGAEVHARHRTSEWGIVLSRRRAFRESDDASMYCVRLWEGRYGDLCRRWCLRNFNGNYDERKDSYAAVRSEHRMLHSSSLTRPRVLRTLPFPAADSAIILASRNWNSSTGTAVPRSVGANQRMLRSSVPVGRQMRRAEIQKRERKDVMVARWSEEGVSAPLIVKTTDYKTGELSITRPIGPPVGNDLPFCRLVGFYNQTGASNKIGHIGLELWLPDREAWNHRYLGVGGDGFRYSLEIRGQFSITNIYSADPGVHLGLTDWIHDSNHYTAVANKALIDIYYGRKPVHSYFTGCSTGGGQALALAQLWPEDFDGIHARVNDGDDLVQGSSSVEVYSGLKDGLISAPLNCSFDPASLACPPGAASSDSCLTASQLAIARAFYSGPVDPVTHKQIYPGFVPGSEITWAVRAGIYHQFTTALFQNTFAKNRIYDPLADFEFHRELPKSLADNINPQKYSLDYCTRVKATVGKNVDPWFRLFHVPGWVFNTTFPPSGFDRTARSIVKAAQGTATSIPYHSS
ncbi:hypothetical protein C8R43DRAFT_941190 [Mycena crocata]|nr:hypothetical protein C8R43DRAFT_941190 [Mycena crocata]